MVKYISEAVSVSLKAVAGSARILFISPQLPGSYVSTQPGHKTHFQFLRM